MHAKYATQDNSRAAMYRVSVRAALAACSGRHRGPNSATADDNCEYRNEKVTPLTASQSLRPPLDATVTTDMARQTTSASACHHRTLRRPSGDVATRVA